MDALYSGMVGLNLIEFKLLKVKHCANRIQLPLKFDQQYY